jgi:hypothetical protein
VSGRRWDGESSAMEVGERLGYYDDYCGLRHRAEFEPEEREDDDNDDEQEEGQA